MIESRKYTCDTLEINDMQCDNCHLTIVHCLHQYCAGEMIRLTYGGYRKKNISKIQMTIIICLKTQEKKGK